MQKVQLTPVLYITKFTKRTKNILLRKNWLQNVKWHSPSIEKGYSKMKINNHKWTEILFDQTFTY